MKRGILMVAMMCAMAMVFGTACVAQDPDLPLTWKGEGEAVFVSENGTQEVDFDFKLKVNEDGTVSGSSSTDDGSIPIERFYYGPEVKHQPLGIKTRKLAIVLKMGDGGESYAIILSGRSIGEKLIYGELFGVRLSKEVKEGLHIGDKMASEIYGEKLPSGLAKAIKKGSPIGCFQMEGKFEK